MGEIVKELKGVNGQLEVYPDKIIIKRKGFLAKTSQGFFKGDKTIYLNQISGIQIKPGASLTNGYIQFTLPGGRESKKGLSEATRDENTILFTKKNNELVSSIKAYIEEMLSKRFQPQVAPLSVADEIKKIKQLLDDGILSEEEFQAQKQKLLNQ